MSIQVKICQILVHRLLWKYTTIPLSSSTPAMLSSNILRPEVMEGFVEASCMVLVDLCCAERPSLSSRRSRKSTQQPSPGVSKLSQKTRSRSKFSTDALVPLPILWFSVDFGWRRCDLRKYIRLYCSRSIKEKSWKKDKKTVGFVGVITLSRKFRLWMTLNDQEMIKFY
jgi:hypothetical protein